MGSEDLTAKQEKFAQLVAEGKTYADAYRGAYDAEKMSPNSIYVNSSKLMEDTKITLRVEELKRGAIKRHETTVDEVLEQLRNWLLFDPLSIVDEETDCVKKLKEMDQQSRLSLAEIQVSEIWGYEEDEKGKKKRTQIGQLKKIKFVDKRATADMFMKKFGAYIPDKSDGNDYLSEIKDIIESVGNIAKK